MEFVKGKVVSVVRQLAGGTLIVAASASDTTLFVDDVRHFDEDGGSIDVDGTVLSYTGIDHDANTLTVPALAAGIAVDTFIAVSPEAPIHTAYVLADDDVAGDPIPARVPLDKRALLPEGPRAPEDMEAATLQFDGNEWTLLDWEFKPGTYDATTTPIIVTTDAGESVRIDGDGITTYTNDPVPLWVRGGNFNDVAANSASVFGIALTSGLTGNIHKLSVSDGAESFSGFPLVGSYGYVAANDTHVFAVDASSDIAKFNASTGASVGSGFPIAGTFTRLAANATHVFAVNSSSDIAKYDASTGSAAGGAFPIAGTFIRVAVNDTHIFAVDSGFDLHKYDISTGVEDTNGFPISGVLWIAVFGTELYVKSSTIDRYDADTGELDETWSINSNLYSAMDASSGRLFIVDDPADGPFPIRAFNTARNYQSTKTDSSDGSASFHATTVTDLTAIGVLTFTGPVTVDGYEVTGAWTSFNPAWTGTIGNGTVTAYYKRIGKTVHFWIQIVGGSTTVWGVTSTNLTLPFAITANISHRQMFVGTFLDSSASAVYRAGAIRGSTTTIIPVIDGTTAGGPMRGLNSTAPVIPGSGDALILSGTYETDAA